MGVTTLLAVTTGTMIAAMALLWLLQRRQGNAGVVDIAWSAGVGLVGFAFAVWSDGDSNRRLLVGALIVVWSLRLAGHVLVRLVGEPEDGRYGRLRQQWGGAFQARLFWFYQFQAVLAVLFALPVLVVASDPKPGFGLQEACATAIWLVAVVGETVADRQLAGFRADPANRGRTCRAGLWGVSRHPNYFFEWLHWWTYVVLGIDAAFGGLTLLGPVLMLFFLLKVTGVPATEARTAASRPDFEEYRRTTSAFIPWFPRRR